MSPDLSRNRVRRLPSRPGPGGGASDTGMSIPPRRPSGRCRGERRAPRRDHRTEAVPRDTGHFQDVVAQGITDDGAGAVGPIAAGGGARADQLEARGTLGEALRVPDDAPDL